MAEGMVMPASNGMTDGKESHAQSHARDGNGDPGLVGTTPKAVPATQTVAAAAGSNQDTNEFQRAAGVPFRPPGMAAQSGFIPVANDDG